MKQNDTITVGMVNDGTIDSQLVIDLIQISRKRSARFDNFVQVSNIGLLTRSRNVLVKNFLDETNAQWLLMIDSDERLTLETFDLLIDSAHDKERPIVSALVFAAFFDDDDQLRPVPTIYRYNNGFACIDDYPENQLIEVDGVGTGCLLIHRKVLEDMRKNATSHQGKNWAWFVDGAIEGTWYGEDLLFSKRLKSLGYKIHAHTGAICAHRKEFWLDERHHQPLRASVMSSTDAVDNTPGQ